MEFASGSPILYLLSGFIILFVLAQSFFFLIRAILFLGMIATFLGMVFKDISTGLAGWVPVFVMLISAVVMLLCALCIKKLKWTWLNEYALPISMVISMALAIPLTAWCT